MYSLAWHVYPLDVASAAMSKRRYNQACPLAFSLDLIGERWTLLIVRDLLLGPLRFGELLRRLPGMGRNMLSMRLQALTEQRIIEKQELAAPAGISVYGLTEKGEALEETLLALSAWGLRYIGAENLEGHGEPDLIGLALKMHADPSRLGGRDLPVHDLAVGPVRLHVAPSQEGVRVRRGAATQPAVWLAGELPVFGGIVSGRMTASDALQGGYLTATGDPVAVDAVLRLYGWAA